MRNGLFGLAVPCQWLAYKLPSAVLHRDGAIVHINYKSQFKDGVTPAKRGSTAAGTTAASRKRKGAGNTRARPAAATGTGGFCTAGEVAAAAAETKGRGKRGRSGKAASGGKGRASKAKGSGGRRKRAGSGGGKWRYRNGRKVRRQRMFCNNPSGCSDDHSWLATPPLAYAFCTSGSCDVTGLVDDYASALVWGLIAVKSYQQ